MEKKQNCRNITSVTLILVLTSLVAFLASSSGVMAVQNDSDTDLQALHCLKLHLVGSSGLLASWKNESLQFCSWPGVTCSKRHPSRVVALDLESLSLNGQIPPCIANLTFLANIHLPKNQLSGPIPPEIGQLSRLQYLNLSSNYLTGVIPDTLASCFRLQIIDLESNSLHGVIPPSLSKCSDIQQLSLGYNMLSGGIPEGLGTLRNLSVLRLATNSLTEYGFGSKISTEVDVYSYGIIILEMLTGKRPTDEMFNDGLSLYKFVEKSFPQNIGGILDPRIVPSYGDEEAGSTLNQENHPMAGTMSCIIELATIGLLCAADIPKDRPAMQYVYSRVTAIKEVFSVLQVGNMSLKSNELLVGAVQE